MCESCIGETCAACGDTGWITEEGKPQEHLTEHASREFRAYRMLKEHGVWPQAGGWERQSAKFLQALDFCTQAAGLYRQRQAQLEEEKQKMLAEIDRMRRNAGR